MDPGAPLIALLQGAAAPGDVAANLETVRAAADGAAAGGAVLLVTPETFTTGYGLAAKRWRGLAEPLDGPAVARLQAIAAGAGIALVCGVVEHAGREVFNTAVLIDRGGSLRQAYRKAHLFGDAERATFAPGGTLAPPVEVEGITVGLLICNDVEFPEMARRLALDGADLIAVPTALTQASAWIPEVLVPARAGENQLHVAYANHVGGEWAGRSTLAGPNGSVISASPDQEQLLVAEVDLDLARRARARQSYLAERRPELY